MNKEKNKLNKHIEKMKETLLDLQSDVTSLLVALSKESYVMEMNKLKNNHKEELEQAYLRGVIDGERKLNICYFCAKDAEGKMEYNGKEILVCNKCKEGQQ